MKNKFLFLIAILGMFSLSANSQSEGISFGLRGGVNFQNINGKDISGDKLDLDIVPRFNVGVVVEIPVAPEFYFQPGILFSTKGAKSDDFQGSNISVEFSPSYIELPLNLLYKPLLGQGHFLLGFGPYVAYGLGGKAKFNSDEAKIEYTDEYSSLLPYGEKAYIKRLDYGANLFFGYELANGISLQLNTQLGLAKINADNTNYPDSDASFKNTGFGITLGYMF